MLIGPGERSIILDGGKSMKERQFGRIRTRRVTGSRNQKRGFIAWRVGLCGDIHEAFGVKENHAKMGLREVEKACRVCQGRLSAQSQLAAAS